MKNRKKSRNEYLQSQLRKCSSNHLNVEIRNRRRSLDDFLSFYNQLVARDESLTIGARRVSVDGDNTETERNLGNAIRSCLRLLAFKKNSSGTFLSWNHPKIIK